MVNQSGLGTINIIMTPPTKNIRPTKYDKSFAIDGMSFTTIIADNNVPKACAKKGITKCLGCIKCMDFFKPSVVVKSVPGGFAIK